MTKILQVSMKCPHIAECAQSVFIPKKTICIPTPTPEKGKEKVLGTVSDVIAIIS